MEETVIDNETVSDSESITCEQIPENALEERALLRLDEGSLEYINLKHRFFLCLGSLAERCSVVAIRRMVPCSSAMSRAQVMAFKLFERAVAEKNGGDPNVKLGWYGTSADGVHRILRSGFDYGAMPIGEYGHGLCIYGDCSVANCILQCVTGANGLKHLVLCRAILGKTEQVLPGSIQCGPSSDEFDSGVDCNQQPKKYFVWNSDVKTRVLPLYFLSIKLHPKTQERSKDDLRRPCSPWVSFTELISALSKCLSSSEVCLIKRFHIRYMERKISRPQLVAHLRQIVGDEILISVIRKYQNKRTMSAVYTCARNGDNKLSPPLRKPTCRTRLG